MQYTASSFAELLSERFLPRPLAPRSVAPALRATLPARAAFSSRRDDPLTARVYEPLFSAVAARFAGLRRLQAGNAHLYLGYILLAVVAALGWSSLRGWWPR
jgi:hydrogenase-4 component B